jgi:cell wall-associated NlpC family hydrolase
MSPSRHSRLFAFALAGIVFASWAGTAGADGNEDRRESRLEQPSDGHRESPTRAERAVKMAVQAVGLPYRWGGESPATGFDCSGLVRWAYGSVGVELPHSSYGLFDVGRPVAGARLAPGDMLFFEGLGHVGLYVGHGRMVHAPQTGRSVEVVRLASGYGDRLIGARRVVSA